MTIRHPRSFRLRPSATPSTAAPPCIRCLHAHVPARATPSPTPFVPDSQTFLTLIGRNLSQHAAKIPTWEALFSLTSGQLRELGVEPARNRRYLLHWRDRFRRGLYGIGGDLTEVIKGVGELQVVEVAVSQEATTSSLAKRPVKTLSGKPKVIVNVPKDKAVSSASLESIKPIKGVKLVGAHTISGPHVLIRGRHGNRARIAVKEGLWEERRGHKIDGGERRKAEVRAKRRAAERKANN